MTNIKILGVSLMILPLFWNVMILIFWVCLISLLFNLYNFWWTNEKCGHNNRDFVNGPNRQPVKYGLSEMDEDNAPPPHHRSFRLLVPVLVHGRAHSMDGLFSLLSGLLSSYQCQPSPKSAPWILFRICWPSPLRDFADPSRIWY